MEVKQGHSGLVFISFIPNKKPENLDQAFEVLFEIKDYELRMAALKGIAMAVISYEAVGKVRTDPESRLYMSEHLKELEEQAKKIWALLEQ